MSHVKKFIPDRSNFCWVIKKLYSFRRKTAYYNTYNNCITRAYTFVISVGNGIRACFFSFLQKSWYKENGHTYWKKERHKSRGSGALLPFKDFSRHVMVIYERKVMKKLLYVVLFLGCWVCKNTVNTVAQIHLRYIYLAWKLETYGTLVLGVCGLCNTVVSARMCNSIWEYSFEIWCITPGGWTCFDYVNSD